jgi:prepilin-type N-terminal cleavage/methylation domain-containing protein
MSSLANRIVRGFTLYELAIVLVVIGTLLGIVIRGTEILHIGALKKECAKIESFRESFASYIQVYKRYPGDSNTETTLLVNSDKAKADLIDAGLLQEGDFNIDLSIGAKQYTLIYKFTRCILDNGLFNASNGYFGTYFSYVFYPDNSTKVPEVNSVLPHGFVCVGAFRSNADNVTITPLGFQDATPIELRAAYEIYFDDRDVNYGKGRRGNHYKDYDSYIGHYSNNDTTSLKEFQSQLSDKKTPLSDIYFIRVW